MSKCEIDSAGWIHWYGEAEFGECPIRKDAQLVISDTNGVKFYSMAGDMDWSECFKYRVSGFAGDVETKVKPVEKKAASILSKEFSHYHKDVSHLKSIDVYRVLDLFNVTDQAVGHAIKKLLVAGDRGSKNYKQDIREAYKTLTRKIEMWEEDESDGK